jgi:hypothetical protein
MAETRIAVQLSKILKADERNRLKAPDTAMRFARRPELNATIAIQNNWVFP